MKKILATLSILLSLSLPSVAWADYTITINSDSGQSLNGYGYSGADGSAQYAIPFTTIGAGTIGGLTYSAKYITITGDQSQVGIQADSAGVPSNSFLGSGNSTLTGSCALYSPSWTPFSVTGTTNYWVVYTRTGALQSGTARYLNCGANSGSGGAYTLGTLPNTWDSSQTLCGGTCVTAYATMIVNVTATAADGGPGLTILWGDW